MDSVSFLKYHFAAVICYPTGFVVDVAPTTINYTADAATSTGGFTNSAAIISPRNKAFYHDPDVCDCFLY